MNILIEQHVCPSIAFFHLVCASKGEVRLEYWANYNKRSYRNRIHLITPQGRRLYSLPLVKGKNQSTQIRTVQLSYDEPWQDQLWRSIKTHYGSAPYFDHYSERVRQWVFYSPPTLIDYSWHLLNQICKTLDIEVNWTCSVDYLSAPSDEVNDLRNTITPFVHFEHPNHARGYELPLKEKDNPSILDALFHLGPETKLFLYNMRLSSQIRTDVLS